MRDGPLTLHVVIHFIGDVKNVALITQDTKQSKSLLCKCFVRKEMHSVQ